MEPIASIIVPTYARPERLAECLDALCALDHPAFEVVVVDDGSPEPASAIVARFEDRLAVRCLRQANAGPAAARNAGAAAARGRILAFTDDDCRPDPGWLSAMTAVIEAQPEALAGGSTTNVLTDDLCAEASQDLVSFLYEHQERRGGTSDFFASNNIACAASAFEALGGFDTGFPLAAGEDRDFCSRWLASGRPLVYAPEAVMGHAHGMSLRGFWRQHANYGRGARHLHRRIAATARPSVAFGGLGFYAGMLAYPFTRRRPRPLARSALIVLSQLAMVAGYAGQVAQDGRQREV